jgi:ATP-dependent RNA helicase RhlB
VKRSESYRDANPSTKDPKKLKEVSFLQPDSPKKKTEGQDPRSGVTPTEGSSRTRHRRPRKRGKKAPQPQAAAASSPVPAAREPWDASVFQVPPAEGKSRFQDLDLPKELLHAIHDLGFQYCTPIQAEILPSTLAGRDASGRAQTGTGKTAAFVITILTRMLQKPAPEKREPGTPRVLILAPTRELVIQISEEARQLSKYCPFKIVSVFGGMDFDKQRKQLGTAPVDVIVATPGRLLDFQRRRDLNLKEVEVLIIDEADRMLDMGFIPDVRRIIQSTPAKDRRQTMLFSATLTGEIVRLASQWTRDPVTVEIEPEQVAVDTVEQIIYIVTEEDKLALLYNIIERENLHRVLVFCNRRDEVNRLAETLARYGINCSVLSGDVPQKTRVRRLEQFKTGEIRVLVATDVAARGLHIEGMDHVINFKLPHDPEDYVHRIGRTGRAGAAGTSISFADEGDAFYIPAIEGFMGRSLSCIQPDDAWLTLPEPTHPEKGRKRERRPRSSRNGSGTSRSRGPRKPRTGPR